jgi:hypothetical protein
MLFLFLKQEKTIKVPREKDSIDIFLQEEFPIVFS